MGDLDLTRKCAEFEGVPVEEDIGVLWIDRGMACIPYAPLDNAEQNQALLCKLVEKRIWVDVWPHCLSYGDIGTEKHRYDDINGDMTQPANLRRAICEAVAKTMEE